MPPFVGEQALKDRKFFTLCPVFFRAWSHCIGGGGRAVVGEFLGLLLAISMPSVLHGAEVAGNPSSVTSIRHACLLV
jgi:hypothetical protein